MVWLAACGGKGTPTSPSAGHATFTVRGVVTVLPTGEPLSGATVRVADGPHANLTAASDATGTYVLSGLSGGLSLRASKEGFGEQTKSAAVNGDLSVDFQLGSSGTAWTGRVSDAVTGDPVSGATLSGSGGTAAMTDRGGFFRLVLSESGPIGVSVTGTAHWTRQTTVNPVTQAVADLTLLPKGQGFSLTFFDHVFRTKGTGATRRWVQEPAFEIWTQKFECLSGPSYCQRLRALGARAGSEFERQARAVLAADVPALTGGALRASSVRTKRHAPGTTIELSEMLATGVTTIALVERTGGRSWAVWQAFDGGMMDAANVQLDAANLTSRCLYSHEIAHALGFEHPDGAPAVPGRSVIRDCVEGIADRPTSTDRLHGRLLYLRPPGSRSPDRDPAGFVLGSLAAGPGGAMKVDAAR